MVLGWCLIWKKDVSFPNLQATHLGFVLCPPVGITRLQSTCRDEEDIVTVHDAECILGTMESVRSMTPFVCCTTVLSRSKLLGAKASARRPRLLIHLSSETTASLAWWVSLAGFAANASVSIGFWTSTAMILTDASLELEGHGTFWKLGLLLGLKGSFWA